MYINYVKILDLYDNVVETIQLPYFLKEHEIRKMYGIIIPFIGNWGYHFEVSSFLYYYVKNYIKLSEYKHVKVIVNDDV